MTTLLRCLLTILWLAWPLRADDYVWVKGDYTASINGPADALDVMASVAEGIVSSALLKEFPDLHQCIDQHSAPQMMAYLKDLVMAAAAVDQDTMAAVQKKLDAFEKAVGQSRWLVTIHLEADGPDKVRIQINCLPLTKEWSDEEVRLARGTTLDTFVEDMQKLAADFVKAFAYYEPEAYKGAISVRVRQAGHDQKETQVPVHCSGSDQVLRRTEDKQLDVNEYWSISKVKRRQPC
jgi:hypothetical protein